MPTFIKGIELSRRFYDEVVRPILERHDSQLAYAAALVGRGSDVLGFDDTTSTDHDWGPTVYLFFRHDAEHLVENARELMRHELPHHFMGYSTNFIPSPEDPSSSVMAITRRGSINHRVYASTLTAYVQSFLGWDLAESLTAADWLTFPSQKLLALTAGAVHHDGIGDLTALRARLAWYPDDVWYYLLAAQWTYIAEDEHLMGRAGMVGDEIGAAVIAARLTQSIMRLCFLMEREYAPYPKWFGTAFQQLNSAGTLTPLLRDFQVAPDAATRQTAYLTLMASITAMQNDLNLTRAFALEGQRFYTRPYHVSRAEAISEALAARISDAVVRRISELPSMIGSIDQYTQSTQLRDYTGYRDALLQLYRS